MVAILVTGLSFGQDLIITGTYDGPLTGGTPKGVELYVVNDIPDLSIYGIGSANNGQGTDGEEFTFPAEAATAGDFIYIATEEPNFTAFFGFAPNYTDGSMAINGDDAVELFQNGAVIDTFGDINVDGNGEPWEYLDGWAYRVDGSGPDGTTFDLASWTFGGVDALEGGMTNASANVPFPIGTYSPMVNTNPSITITSPNNGQAFPEGTTSVELTIVVQNFNVGATTGGFDGHIHWTIDSGSGPVMQPMKYDTNPETIPVTEGETYTVYMELVDNMHQPIVPAVNTTVTFSVLFPCDIQVGTITTTCDAITPGSTDTYNVTIDYTGGGTTTYTIDTGGVGTVGGDNPTSVTDGTITISGITEGTDFTVTFTGDAANSSCDFTRDIDSPNCDPQLMLPQYDTFDYADGPLVGNSEWQVTGSSSSDDLLVTSGQALVQHGTPSQDVNLPFASVTGDLFYAFDMTVVDPGGPIAGTDNEYFAHFKDSGFGFSARLDIVPPSGAGDYTLGIATSAGSADATWATDLSYGTTYRVTVRYDQDANFAELWVDASSESDTSILGADEDDMNADIIEAFAFRQSDSDLNEGILVDNLAITESFAETLSNDDYSIADTFKVYPNPTSLGFVNITSTNNADTTVAVYDVLGKEVINTVLSNDQLNVSGLNSGVYIMKISQNNASVTKKLIIK